MAKCSDSSSSAAASIPQSSGIYFALELPLVPWQDNKSNVSYHNDNESVTRSTEHDPPSRDLVHSWMGSRHPSNSYGRPNNSVGNFLTEAMVDRSQVWDGSSMILLAIKVTVDSAFLGDLVEWDGKRVAIKVTGNLHHIGRKIPVLIIPLNGCEHSIVIVYHLLVGQYYHASLAYLSKIR